MKRVAVQNLQPGMITAVPVISNSGQLIINKGVELDDRLIDRLDFYGIAAADIESEEAVSTEEEPVSPVQPEPIEEVDETSLAIEEPAPIVEEPPALPVTTTSYAQKLKSSTGFMQFQISYSQKIANVKESITKFLNSEDVDLKEMLADTVSLISDNHLTTLDLLDMLHNIRQVDDTVYAHSLNVSLITRALAKWLKLSREDIDLLTLAGLLHDVGKTQIPTPILNKPGKLSNEEFSIIKMHPKMGYDMIKDKNIDPRIKQSVLMHHERCDGSGYPSGINGRQIDDFSKILAIADVYDAMTAARSYRPPLSPFQVISSFEDEGLQKYDPHYILTFLERIANAYQNNRVMLSDGRPATVILLNKGHLSRPTVRLENGSFIDLSTNRSVSIVSVI